MKRQHIMQKFLDYLHLKDIGIIELVFSFALLLTGFSIFSLPLSDLIWVVLLAIIIIKGRLKKIQFYKPLLLLVTYWLLHTSLLLLVDDVNINAILEQLVFFISIFAIYPNINLTKLKGSLNWVAIIAIIGLLYQWSMIAKGNMVHQLEIPGLSISEESLEKELFRPSSFFQEPSAYVAFMMSPLAFSLMDKKYLWSIVMIMSIFLTTSTTGIFVCFIMLLVSIMNQRTISKKTVFIIGLLIVTSFYSLTRLEVFESSKEKLEDTDPETNVRLTQGPYVVSTMETGEYIFGVSYSSAYNYCKAGRAPSVAYYGNRVFMSTFWQLILLYGVVGLLLYLYIYYRIFKECRESWPLLACLCAELFSSGYALGVYFVFTLIVLLTMVRKCNTKICFNGIKNNLR